MPFDRNLRNPVPDDACCFTGDREAAAVGATVGAVGTLDAGRGAAVDTGTMCTTGFNLRTFLTGFRTLVGRFSEVFSFPSDAAAVSAVATVGGAVTGRAAESVVCLERTFTTGRLKGSAAAAPAAGTTGLAVGPLGCAPNLIWAKEDSVVGGALLCSSGSVVRVRRGGTAGTGLRWVPRAKDVVGKSSVDVVVVTASWRRKGDRLGCCFC